MHVSVNSEASNTDTKAEAYNPLNRQTHTHTPKQKHIILSGGENEVG